jgi:hypothetical protein
VRYEVPTMLTVNVPVFWDVIPGSVLYTVCLASPKTKLAIMVR